MTDEPKGIVLKDLGEIVQLHSGTSVNVLAAGKQVELTRKLAIIQALETYSDAKKQDKFLAFDLGMRFSSSNSQISISADESVMIKLALESQWPQPGIYVPLCRWLEGA